MMSFSLLHFLNFSKEESMTYPIEMLSVIAGGGLGAFLRWNVSLGILRTNLPLWSATLLVNLIGCTFIFLVSKYFAGSSKVMQSFIKVGILGSLTTFSTFSLEVVTLFKSGKFVEGGLVLFLNVFFGIIIGIGIFR
jgi:fluoride exporter